MKIVLLVALQATMVMALGMALIKLGHKADSLEGFCAAAFGLCAIMGEIVYLMALGTALKEKP